MELSSNVAPCHLSPKWLICSVVREELGSITESFRLRTPLAWQQLSSKLHTQLLRRLGAAVPRAYGRAQWKSLTSTIWGLWGAPGAITVCASSSLFGGLTQEAYRPFNCEPMPTIGYVLPPAQRNILFHST